MKYFYSRKNVTKSQLCKEFVLEWIPNSIPDNLRDYIDYEEFVEDELRMLVTSTGRTNIIISDISFDELSCYYM